MGIIIKISKSSVVSVQENQLATIVYDFITIDGGVLIHPLPGTTGKGNNFGSCFDKAFSQRVSSDLYRLTTVDVM